MTTNPNPTVKTRLCIISDTHTEHPKPSKAISYAYRDPLPSANILIHAGDLTKVGYEFENATTLDVLKSADAELKLVIAGNHDITLHEEFYMSRGKRKHRNVPENVRKIREMWTGDEALDAGIVYLEEGTRSFQLSNGAKFTIYSSPWQPEYYDWAFTYNRMQDRFNPSPAVSKFKAPNPIPDHPKIDIMLTHGPPRGILDVAHTTNEEVGCDHLRRAVERCKPRLHCFGHIHEGWGAERLDWVTKDFTPFVSDKQKILADRSAYVDLSEEGGSPLRWGQETLFVNASIMDITYRPSNAPWIVDLDLPVVKFGKNKSFET